MDWLSQNWVWVLIAIAFIAMHTFGHGGHGSHGSQGGGCGGRKSTRDPTKRPDENGSPAHRY